MGCLLSEVFDSRSIKLDLDGKTKEMAFVELIESIAALNPECDRKDIIEAIKKREEKMNTGICSGVAIPRAYCRGIGNMAGAIGVSKEGIDYGAPDSKPVHVIFLLALSENAKENHLHVLNQIFNLAHSEAFALIKSAKNAQDIHTILSRTYLVGRSII